MNTNANFEHSAMQDLRRIASHTRFATVKPGESVECICPHSFFTLLVGGLSWCDDDLAEPTQLPGVQCNEVYLLTDKSRDVVLARLKQYADDGQNLEHLHVSEPPRDGVVNIDDLPIGSALFIDDAVELQHSKSLPARLRERDAVLVYPFGKLDIEPDRIMEGEVVDRQTVDGVEYLSVLVTQTSCIGNTE